MKSYLSVLLCLLSIATLSVAEVTVRQSNLTAQQEQGLETLADLDLPRCGALCFAQVFPQFGCPLDNPSCLCPNANITNDISACVFSNCTIPEQLLVERQSKDLCGAVSRNEAYATRRVTWSLFALACLFVIARFIARPERLHGSGYGRDDWTILACVALLVPVNVLIEAMTKTGLGGDNYKISADGITLFLEFFFIFTILYTILIMISKVSILQLYLRIWTHESVTIWFRRTCWLLVAVHIVTMLAFVLAMIFVCTPVSFSWHYWDGLHEGRCLNRSALLYALGAVNIGYDVVVFVLPLHNFLKLNISGGRKIGVCTIFMVGILVTICSIVRLQYLVKIGRSDNPTWDYNKAVIWSSVECNLSVVCTCMPAMAGLLQRVWAQMTGSPVSVNTRSTSSRAAIHPRVIDPEVPVSDKEVLRMRKAGNSQTPSFAGSVTEFGVADTGAPTAVMREKGEQQTPITEQGIRLKHEPPTEKTSTRLTYRDVNGRLHEVKVVDEPTDDVITPEPVNVDPEEVDEKDDVSEEGVGRRSYFDA